MIWLLLACATDPTPPPVRAENPLLHIDRIVAEPISAVADEVIDAGHYRYVRVGQDWHVVMSSKPVPPGQSVTLKPMGVAEDFRSRALDRTFSRLTFSVRL